MQVHVTFAYFPEAGFGIVCCRSLLMFCLTYERAPGSLDLSKSVCSTMRNDDVVRWLMGLTRPEQVPSTAHLV